MRLVLILVSNELVRTPLHLTNDFQYIVLLCGRFWFYNLHVVGSVGSREPPCLVNVSLCVEKRK